MSTSTRIHLSSRFTAALFAVGALLVAHRAEAQIDPIKTPFFEYDGATTGVSGKLLAPCVKVAFEANADRSEPATSTQGAYGPTLTVSNPETGRFVLKLAMTDDNGHSYRLLPPGPCKDGACQNVNVQAVADDGTMLLLHFSIASRDSKLDPGSVVGFNPQPEPPGDFSGDSAMIVDFSMQSPTTVQASLVVLNQSTGRVVVVR